MNDTLVYTFLNTDKIVVRGNKDKYDAILKTIGGKWNASLKAGPGWVIEREKEQKLKKLIGSLKSESSLTQLKGNIKSRKEQKKFHRAISEIEFKKENLNLKSAKNNKEEEKKNGDYYKKFKTSPKKKVVSVPVSDSSSDSSVYKKS